MNYSIHRISLDIHDTSSQVGISVKRGDSNRLIIVTLTENGKPYVITNECRAEFNGKAIGTSGDPIKVDCDIKNNTIRYVISPSVTNDSGTKECEFKLYGANNALLTAPRFTIYVEDSIYNGKGVTEGEGEVSTLTALISEATTLIYDIETKLKNGELKGEKGEDGYTPVKGVDYFDGKDGNTPVKGIDYFDGKDGYTPIKGTDYFTTEDKTSIVSEVIASLPVYKGEVIEL